MTQQDRYELQQNSIFDNLLKTTWIREEQGVTKNKIVYEHCVDCLELIITSQCNQKCTYCYLQKHQDQLYPEEIRNNRNIIDNLNKLLDYFLELKAVIKELDLYSGEIWGTTLSYSVFDSILQAVDKGLAIDAIVIPSNCSFMLDNEVTSCIIEYVDKFSSRGIDVGFSCSIDGALLEQKTRPFRNDSYQRCKDFYDKIFDVRKFLHMGFHPMVDASTIKYQCQSLDWWINQFKKHNQLSLHDWYNSIMFLEVRDDRWTEENLIDYCKWIMYLFDKEIETFWSDKKDKFLTYRLANLCDKNQHIAYSYSPISCVKYKSEMPCSAGHSLNVRLGDLAIVPCHRTCYDANIYGHFDYDKTRITGVKAKNPLLMNAIVNTGRNLMHKCSSCPIRDMCSGGCLGAQLEASGELFNPINCVCDLYKIRIIALHHKVLELNRDLGCDTQNIQLLNRVYNNLQITEKEFVEKWEMIIAKAA